MMDNTRVLSSNGTPYGMAHEKKMKTGNLSSQKSAAPLQFDTRKGSFINTGSMLTICSGQGAHLLLNTTSIASATSMQFVPPVRTKSDLCDVSSIRRQTLFTKPIALFDHIENTNNHNRITSDLVKKTKVIMDSVVYKSLESLNDITQSNTKIHSDSSALVPGSVEGNIFVNTVNTFKNFFRKVSDNLLKPITTTMFVGTDNNTKLLHDQMAANKMHWSDTDGLMSHNINHKTIYDDHSSDSFSYSSDKSYSNNNWNETFFDCDDYVDGGEDTIDFVADSTKTQYDAFGNEISTNSPVYGSTKDAAFYDCITKSVLDEIVQPPSPLPPVNVEVEEKSAEKTELPEAEENDIDESEEIHEKMTDETFVNVQYLDDANAPMKGLKNWQQNRNAYRRKRRGKRKHKNNGNRKKATGPNKNRHEKIRHEVEMNIHDDIDDCSIVQNGTVSFKEPDSNNMEENTPKSLTINNIPIKSNESTATATTSTTTDDAVAKLRCVETPIPSPEEIPGCIFTRFFRLDNSRCRQPPQSLPMRCIQKLTTHLKPLKERPVSTRRTSETESDDSFIVFEEYSPKSTTSVDDLMPKYSSIYKRQRQLSDCSDDFILFADDDDDDDDDDGSLVHCYTTDEDFTDSTDDDTDCSDDESSDDSDSECSPISCKQKDDHNQPDSGFEEKKVTFNLCPIVHEIRAWKFAYSEARKGKWDQIALDRGRFEKRINELSRILTPILATGHRQRIFDERFRSDKCNE